MTYRPVLNFKVKDFHQAEFYRSLARAYGLSFSDFARIAMTEYARTHSPLEALEVRPEDFDSVYRPYSD